MFCVGAERVRSDTYGRRRQGGLPRSHLHVGPGRSRRRRIGRHDRRLRRRLRRGHRRARAPTRSPSPRASRSRAPAPIWSRSRRRRTRSFAAAASSRGAPDIRNGVGDIVAIVGTPTQPLTVNISGVTVDGYDPQGREVAVEAGILFLDAKGSISRTRVTNIVTSEGDNAYTRAGGWRGRSPASASSRRPTRCSPPWTARAARDRPHARRQVQQDRHPDRRRAERLRRRSSPSGAVNWGVITASQIIGRTECVNYAGTGNCASVGPAHHRPAVRPGRPARHRRLLRHGRQLADLAEPGQRHRRADAQQPTTNNANLTLGAGVRYAGREIAQYASATGQVVYSRDRHQQHRRQRLRRDQRRRRRHDRRHRQPEPRRPRRARATCSRPRTTGGACATTARRPTPARRSRRRPTRRSPENPVNGTATRDPTVSRRHDLQRGRLLPVPQRPAVGPDQRRSTRC